MPGLTLHLGVSLNRGVAASGGGDPPIAPPDFTGWTAGAVEGNLPEGAFPTDMLVNLNFAEGDDPNLSINEASGVFDGIESLMWTFEAFGAGCSVEFVFPTGYESFPTLFGQTWRAAACLRIEGGDATPTDVFLSVVDGVNTDPIPTEGNFSETLRTAEAVIQVPAFAYGSLGFTVPAGTLTLRMALVLEQIG